MNDAAKAVLSRYLLGDGTMHGYSFSTKFPNKAGAVSHAFYVLRPNGSVWGKESNFGMHVHVFSMCGRWARQIGNLRQVPRDNTRICKGCLRAIGKAEL